MRHAVDEPCHGIRVPLYTVGVEIRDCAARKSLRVGKGRRTRITRPVQRGARYRRLATLVLHDVDLAAVRPRLLWTGAAQHPERGPQSLAAGQFDARLELAGWLHDQLATSSDLR